MKRITALLVLLLLFSLAIACSRMQAPTTATNACNRIKPPTPPPAYAESIEFLFKPGTAELLTRNVGSLSARLDPAAEYAIEGYAQAKERATIEQAVGLVSERRDAIWRSLAGKGFSHLVLVFGREDIGGDASKVVVRKIRR
jgi:hypothetical protein